jgi:hypothetical protein
MDETHTAASYWICGMVVHVDHVLSAQAVLQGVAEKAAANYEMPKVPELHGYELFSREGSFKGMPPRVCVGIYADALDALVEAEPVIILRGVDRQKVRMQNPHRLAWRYAIESVDELGGEGPTQVVADEHAETEQALRGDIRSYITDGTGGWKPRTIKNVLPGLKFVNSRENSLLQAADLVAYLHQRRFNVPAESDARSQSAREMLWTKLAPFVRAERIWTPPY